MPSRSRDKTANRRGRSTSDQPPHAAKPAEAVGSPLVVGGQDDFGVAVRAEDVSEPFELLSQLDVIVDLAVIGEPQAIAVRHWLPAGRLKSRIDKRRCPSATCQGALSSKRKNSVPEPSGPRWATASVIASSVPSGTLAAVRISATMPHIS